MESLYHKYTANETIEFMGDPKGAAPLTQDLEFIFRVSIRNTTIKNGQD
jgi:hypothetical protein